MHIFHTTKGIILETLRSLLPLLQDHPAIEHAVNVEFPRDASHGDLATNAAMVCAKIAQTAPRELAEKIAEKLRTHPSIQAIEVAGPGFINITMRPVIWQNEIRTILSEKTHYGNSSLGQGVAVNVEYVSVNPTGPMHIGHARCAAFGDTLAKLVAKIGFDVTKEYYINDAGGQMDVVAKSCFIRYRQALGETNLAVPEGLYPGDYLIPLGQQLKEEFGDSLLSQAEAEWLPLLRKRATAAMMLLIKDDLKRLNIQHDIFTSELTLHETGMIDEAVRQLEGEDLLYTGQLPPPKGKENEAWEAREQFLFASSRFGDDTDRAMKKADGSWTYFAADFGYAHHKLQRGFKELILVIGADHAGYVKRMEAMVAALSHNQVPIDIRLCQLVHFKKDGEPLKMSKRAGSYITVHDVIDLVGTDSVRFMMLNRKHDIPMDFDLDLVIKQSRDNPVFYVQYAHARAKSILRNAEEALPNITHGIEAITTEQLALLTVKEELALLRTLASWPKIIEGAALAREPHRVVFYLQELAAAFHGLWNVGKEDAGLRFILQDNPALTLARLAMVSAVAHVVASGLELCAIQPLEQMG
jgi:arginyl-tRNA synthetase